MEQAVKERIFKILKITGNVLVYVFFALCLAFLVLSIASKRDVDGAVKIFGHEMRIVLTGSMEKNEHTWDQVKQYKIKNIPQYSAVFVELVPDDREEAQAWYAELEVGDVLTFRYVMAGRQETITHRIIEIEEKTGGRLISLKAENGAGTPDTWDTQIIDTSATNSTNYIIGKVTGKNYLLGLITYEVKQPLGIALIIIVPCVILIIWQVVKIVNVLNAGKREKAEEKAQAQQSELEELKRRIALLEGEQTDGPPADSENK